MGGLNSEERDDPSVISTDMTVTQRRKEPKKLIKKGPNIINSSLFLVV